jgi:hypothetical protein
MKKELSKDIAQKVLATVDAGLCSGKGKPVPGQMCVEAAVCFALGEPHGDEPSCVGAAVRSAKIALNDSGWSTNEARAKGMRRIAIAQLGSDTIDQQKFASTLAELTIRKIVPIALREAAKLHPVLSHQEALSAAASRCEQEGTRDAARAAAYAANAAIAAANAAIAAAYAAIAAANAAAYAAIAAANAAAYAASAVSQ